MTESARRGVKEGLEFGLGAGIIFATVEIAGATMMGSGPVMSVRMLASVVLGHAAFDTATVAKVLLVGGVVHLALSAIFGVAYGLFAGRLPPNMQTSLSKQAWLGLVFGATLWLVNFRLVSVIFYPWFLQMPQVLQMFLHATFFGLPLALMYAVAERRAHPNRRAPAAFGSRL
jgi:hypothetical protein